MKTKLYIIMLVLTAGFLSDGYADGLEKYIVTVGATNGLTLGVNPDSKQGK